MLKPTITILEAMRMIILTNWFSV